MNLLFVGVLLFFGVHSIRIVAPGWREQMRVQWGENAWKGAYSLVSLLGFGLIVVGYSQARLLPELIYSPPGWTRHLAVTLLLPVFPLLVAAKLPGHIRALLRHPMLLATICWSAAHLLTTTTRADLLLFGSFLGWALADLASETQRPGAAPLAGKAALRNDLIAIVVGLGLYVAMAFWLHLKLIGIAPFGA